MYPEDFVNEVRSSIKLASLSDMLKPESSSTPVDLYFRSMRSMLTYGDGTRLSSEPFLGRLLVVGLVSASEAYFRGILASCIEMCPIAQSHAATRQIHLGGLLWHGKRGFSRSAFEHSSFASREDLTKVFRDYLNFKMEASVFDSPLEQYEIVCQLRHGIVHGDGLLPGRNAVHLDIPRYDRPVRIVIEYAQLQEIAAVITALVVTLNRELFSKMCERWAIQWRTRVDWNPKAEVSRFN